MEPSGQRFRSCMLPFTAQTRLHSTSIVLLNSFLACQLSKFIIIGCLKLVIKAKEIVSCLTSVAILFCCPLKRTRKGLRPQGWAASSPLQAESSAFLLACGPREETCSFVDYRTQQMIEGFVAHAVAESADSLVSLGSCFEPLAAFWPFWEARARCCWPFSSCPWVAQALFLRTPF